MNLLLIPATDWLRHPVPSRQHHIFEAMAKTDNVHVLQFHLFPQNPPRETRTIIHNLHEIPSRGLAQYYALNMPVFWKEILRIIKSEGIEIVVTSNLLPGTPMLLGNLSCKKVVDLKDMFSDNSAIYYQNPILSSVIKGTSEWLLQRLLRNADHVITVSAFLVNYLRRIGVDRISLITNGADLAIFKPDLDPKAFDYRLAKEFENCPVLGFVGTIDKWIDFETVLASLKELSLRIDRVKLLVVGGKMVTNFFEEVKLQVQRAGLQDHVVFTGIVPHSTVPYYISLMDVCLIPMKPDSRLNQARCPDKLFEYLACGKPVVSTRLSEVVRIGKNAVKFYDDAKSLTQIVTEILQDRALRDSMKMAALDIARNYDWQSITEKYRGVLEEVLRSEPYNARSNHSREKKELVSTQ
jgi:glycosyltransferase involved in cell wall biosynthesis